jgi:putative transcriptional regulator
MHNSWQVRKEGEMNKTAKHIHANEILKKARASVGLTQVQVAGMGGITERTYQDYEYGKLKPGATVAIRIAKALNSTVEELFNLPPIFNDERSVN